MLNGLQSKGFPQVTIRIFRRGPPATFTIFRVPRDNSSLVSRCDIAESKSQRLPGAWISRVSPGKWRTSWPPQTESSSTRGQMLTKSRMAMIAQSVGHVKMHNVTMISQIDRALLIARGSREIVQPASLKKPGMKMAPDARSHSRFNFSAFTINNRPQAASSKRSWFMTLLHAAAKSFTNFSFESAQAYTSARARSCECEPKIRSTRVAVHLTWFVLRSRPS
jgi:hypothetical protein